VEHVETHLNVALLQIEAHGRDMHANLRKGLRACREAAADGANIALFPEMWSIGYELIEGEPVEDLQNHAITADDPFLDEFAQLAAELQLAIAVTYLQRWPGRPRNAVVVYDRHGNPALEYAKVHTCDFSLECALTPGDGFRVCELDTTAGTVMVGAMICFDALFPEAARVLMLEGAEVVLVPNSSDYEPWRIGVLQTRAIENMIAIAMANYPGPETEGHSCAFDPIAYHHVGDIEGANVDPTIVRAGREEGIYLARIDLARLRSFRAEETQGDAYRKPGTYDALTRPAARPPFVRPDARR
jgi:predicted amidohydrolase